jgi:hypothetical protein
VHSTRRAVEHAPAKLIEAPMRPAEVPTSMDEHSRSAHGDRLTLALRALSAPREYIRPWYVAYFGMVTAGLLAGVARTEGGTACSIS